MELTTRKRIESKVLIGAAFVIAILSEGRRIALALQMANRLEEIERIQRSAKEVAQRAKAALQSASQDADAAARLLDHPAVLEASALMRKIDAIRRNDIYPAYVRALLVGVEGLTIDGKPVTAEQVIAEAPREFYGEILEHVLAEFGLSEDETGNSESPITSNAPEDGRVTNTSAELVEDAGTTI